MYSNERDTKHLHKLKIDYTPKLCERLIWSKPFEKDNKLISSKNICVYSSKLSIYFTNIGLS